MRPVRLEMTAFGPFADTEVIKFHELGDNPLFLINGATGSGKTTILDAICFALYGETTGNERQASEMRCDHAAAETLTSVELVFELGGARYRIKRIPEQERPKSRGEGTTQQKPSAELYQLADDDSEELLVPSKISEANSQIIELTGLSAEQFRQVMVLPQGKFRELLLADSQEREQIFRQLFQTQIYSRLERQLKVQANHIVREVTKLKQHQESILTTVEMEDSETLKDELTRLKRKIKKLKKKKSSADKQHKNAIEALSLGQQLEQQFKQLDAAQKTQAELLQQEEEFKKRELTKDLAEHANTLRPVFDQLDRAKQARLLAYGKLTTAKALADKTANEALDKKAAKEKADQKKPDLEQQKKQQVQLESYRERSQQLSAARKGLEQREQALTAAESQQKASQQKLITQKEELEEHEKNKDALSKQSIRLPKVQSQLQQVERIIGLRIKLDQHHADSQQLGDKLADAESELLRAKSNLAEQSRDRELLEQRWQAGQAAILAAKLESNVACPVCGSHEHPVPAHSDETLPTEDDLKRANEQESQAREERDACLKAVSSHQSDIKAKSANIKETTTELGQNVEQSLEILRNQLESLSTEEKDLQSAHDQLPELEEGIARIKGERSKAKVELESLRKKASAAAQSAAAARTDLSNKEAELPEAYRDPSDLEAEINKTISEVKQLDEAIKTAQSTFQQAEIAMASASKGLELASRAAEDAAKQLTQENVQWQSRIEKSLFKNEAAFVDAKMEQEPLETLAASIKKYRDALLESNASVEQQQKAISGKQRPNLPALQEEEKQFDEASNQAETRFHQKSERKKILKSAAKKLKTAKHDQHKLEQQYAVVGTLSEVANGNNAHNLSLQRFVLSVLLDDVLISAGHRLETMSKGRYQLLRKEDVGDRRSKSGLDLEVEDAYSGKRRPVATLSGGESFMAALSLALGLSDVVQAYAGGIRLDALFIDEGFGSLDPDSLDLAINTLIDLQATGRMVGVISHVPELKERIATRLDVLADRAGSSTRLVRP